MNRIHLSARKTRKFPEINLLTIYYAGIFLAENEIYQQTEQVLFCSTLSSPQRINSKRMVIDLSEWKMGDKENLNFAGELWEIFEFYKKMTKTDHHHYYILLIFRFSLLSLVSSG